MKQPRKLDMLARAHALIDLHALPGNRLNLFMIISRFLFLAAGFIRPAIFNQSLS